jgi:hypothetical protein
MATIATGYTFADGQTATPVRLNALAGSATVTFTTAADTDDASLEVSGNKFRVKDSGITAAKQAAGVPVQLVEATPITAVQTISATIPLDNTKPQQSTEGTQLWSQAMTLAHSTNKVLVEARVQVANGATGTTAVLALFRDSGADALAVSFVSLPAQAGGVAVLRYLDTPGATSATYKVRLGKVTGGGDIFVSGSGAGGNLFNGTLASTLSLTEIRA